MTQIPYVFNQLTQWIPKDAFDRLVGIYRGNAYVKDYTCWNHLLVMLWAQLTSRRSLRDIETSLRAHCDKLYRMGIGRHVSRNNIANSNARRDVSIYRELACRMMCRASAVRMRDKGLAELAERFSVNGFFAVDSSTVTLSLDRCPWCVPQEGCGGVKLHTMYDLIRETPRICLITGHEERDQTFMEDYPYESGCVYVFDKAYMKTAGLAAVNAAGGYFIVRRKKNILYDVLEDNPAGGAVMADRTIRFSGRCTRRGYPGPLRMVSCYVGGKNEVMQFLTNNTDMPAETVAALYKHRWKIELFFRWIKQHLRITSFYGTSANAVMVQIYTAFTAYCVLALAADALKYKGSLYDFSNLVSVSLTEKVWLKDLITRYEDAKSDWHDERWPSLFGEVRY